MRFLLILSLIVPLAAKTPEWERAQQHVKASEYKQAVQVLEKASNKDPDNLQLLGEAWFGLKEYSKAIDVLEKAAKLAPGSSHVQMWLGRAWGRRAEGNKLMGFSWARHSKNAFEKSVELDPKNMDALDDLFEYYFEAPGIVGGGLDKAEGIAKRIEQINKPKGDELLERVAKERKK